MVWAKAKRSRVWHDYGETGWTRCGIHVPMVWPSRRHHNPPHGEAKRCKRCGRAR